MAKYALGPGEWEIQRAHAVYTREHMRGTLVLTNRRVMMVCRQPRGQLAGGVLGATFGILGTLIGALFDPRSPQSIAVHVWRREVAGADGSGSRLRVRSRRPQFDFEVAIDRASAWAETIQTWADGPEPEQPAQPLPEAKVIKR